MFRDYYHRPACSMSTDLHQSCEKSGAVCKQQGLRNRGTLATGHEQSIIVRDFSQTAESSWWLPEFVSASGLRHDWALQTVQCAPSSSPLSQQRRKLWRNTNPELISRVDLTHHAIWRKKVSQMSHVPQQCEMPLTQPSVRFHLAKQLSLKKCRGLRGGVMSEKRFS